MFLYSLKTDSSPTDHFTDTLTLPPSKRAKLDDGCTDVDSQTDQTDWVPTDFYFTAGAPSFILSPPAQQQQRQQPTGSGTVVAILDSGVNRAHMSLAGKVLPESRSFVSQDSSDISDVLGHGTQCAGLACGLSTLVDVNGQQLSFSGIATDASVLVCKVVPDGSKEADISAVCSALDYIAKLNPQLSVNVVSLSFGTPYYYESIGKRILSLLHSNIVIVCAASNDGRSKSQPISYPARMGDVLCIGACEADTGEAARFSPVGREIDFLAPGKDIWAPGHRGESEFVSITGTSFAAPAVAGLVCCIIEDLKHLAVEVNSTSVIQKAHNVWVIREILKSISTVHGHHDEKRGCGTLLEPMNYFGKSSPDKVTLLQGILGP